jgi:fibronectin-binding autotransporter adhesin
MSTYTPIASHTLGSATSTLMFSSIPQGYTDLVLTVSNVKHSYSGSDTVRDNVAQFNGDNGSNYSVTMLYGDGSTAGTLRSSNINAINVDYPMASASTTGHIILNIQNYSNSTTYKTVLARTATSTRASAFATLWRNTAAITSINVGASGSYTMSAGTVISLYGIQVGASTQKAQGGNIVVSDGTYMYHAFTSSGSFTPSQSLTADVLVIAGGGGGGKDKGGGGGAGGLSYQTSRSLTATTYPVIVGAAGAGGTVYSVTASAAFAGNNSIFDTITSLGGGFGGTDYYTATRHAGSGGSGGGASRTGNIGTATQGNSGGATGFGNAGGTGSEGSPFNYYGGGGGGGAGSAGTNAGSSTAAAGGAGVNTYSSWASATSTGVSGYYAGGGGAGQYNGNNTGQNGGTGGTGGGGNGGGGASGQGAGVGSNAVANTGSGGGGGGDASNGGNGGSGIVIVRYLL